MYSLAVVIVAEAPAAPDHYKAMIPDGLGIMHTVIEVHPSD
jgi:hypothetical protein